MFILQGGKIIFSLSLFFLLLIAVLTFSIAKLREWKEEKMAFRAKKWQIVHIYRLLFVYLQTENDY